MSLFVNKVCVNLQVHRNIRRKYIAENEKIKYIKNKHKREIKTTCFYFELVLGKKKNIKNITKQKVKKCLENMPVYVHLKQIHL